MRKKVFLSAAAIFITLIIGFSVLDFHYAAKDSRTEFYDLSALLQQETFTEEEYEILFRQTGLGKAAISDLREESEDFAESVRFFQTQKLAPLRYRQTFLFFPTTTAEQLLDEEGNERFLTLPPLKNGDILITRSTKTLCYHHGHCALVFDAEHGKTAEALMIGTPSAILQTDLWCSYPTLLILRPKEADSDDIENMLTYAQKSLTGVPYNLLTGLIKKDKSDRERADYTQCSHLVWQAYRQLGIELDSDGGWLVTPCDIARSDELEVVFSYGFGEEGKW